MQIIKYPKREQLKKLLQRPMHDFATIEKSVQQIIDEVKESEDAALKKYTLQFDKVSVNKLRVGNEEIKRAEKLVGKKLKEAIEIAYKNIYKFHAAQQQKPEKIETTKGIVCWRESRPIEQVGLYIPGGSAPLFSTALMLAIPAKIAGCKRVVLYSPPGKDGNIHPAILFAAKLCGVHEIYRTGGAQAIAAMAYGTKTMAPVNKIFGPGNQYVTDSQVVFITTKEKIAGKIVEEVKKQLAKLPRKAIAEKALQNSKIIIVENKENAVGIINEYAPEHLILAVKDSKYYIKNVSNAGSVFIGNYTPESAGDYASGTNHTLPTNGYAKVYSGVSLDSFVKKITYQEISKAGLKKLGNVIELMAEAEHLHAHKNAVSIRLKKIKS